MPDSSNRQTLGIEEWFRGLDAATANGFSPSLVGEHIQSHSITPSSLEPYSFFSSRYYTRNLIFRNAFLECLVLCWDIGQSTPIHDHNGNYGWVYLAAGQLLVRNYRIKERSTLHRTCRLVPTTSIEASAGQSIQVDLEQAIHQVDNPVKYNRRAISVHVYQTPISECEIYCLETGSYEVIPLRYTSEYGRLAAGSGVSKLAETQDYPPLQTQLAAKRDSGAPGPLRPARIEGDFRFQK